MAEEKFNIFDDHHLYDLQLTNGATIRLSDREEINRYLLNPDNPIPEVVGQKTWLSNYVIKFWAPLMKPNAFAVYTQLTSLCFGEKEYAYPTIGYLVETTGMSESTVRRAIDTLQDLNFVVVIQVWDTRRNTNAPNLYLLSRTIPYLSDKQLVKLSKRLQKEHADFVEKTEKRSILFE